MTNTAYSSKDSTETHVDTGDEIVIYDEENTSAFVQSNAYLPLDKVQ